MDNMEFPDKEEEIYKSLEQDEWVSDSNSEIKEKYEAYARSSLKKERQK